ncbi:hypothetical protein B0J12DRAFT_632568, partial [Macrophomina phaseolina]
PLAITTTVAIVDRASQVLAQVLPSKVLRTYAALAEWGDVPLYPPSSCTRTAFERGTGPRLVIPHLRRRESSH